MGGVLREKPGVFAGQIGAAAGQNGVALCGELL